MKETYYLPVGIIQEAIHCDVDGQITHAGQWHLTVYPFNRTVCANDWTTGQIIRASRGMTTASIAGCAECQAMVHKLVDAADGKMAIPISGKMARLRAKRDGYGIDVRMTEVGII